MEHRSSAGSALAEKDWIPTPESIAASNVGWLMRAAGVHTYPALHAWSAAHREEYWALAIERLGVRFQARPQSMLDASGGVEHPHWLPGARLNIVESCLQGAADEPAILEQKPDAPISRISRGQLARLTYSIAASLRRDGHERGTAFAVLMPMTAEAVAIYLGIIAAGCVVVGIADSFQPQEIATRLRLGKASGLFTQDVLLRGQKALPLYARAVEAGAPPTVVLAAGEQLCGTLRVGDRAWSEFLDPTISTEALPGQPGDAINILFSSGTTGEPKAIPWTQTTPIKCAADAHFHQDVRPGDVLAWPTNLGWMMGPWLIFASLMNGAAMALYQGAPTERGFGEFVSATRTTMLGVVPSLVKAWRTSGVMDDLDWSAVKLCSSTGECSSREDMRWLMERTGGKPIIEYCGGTEIGGGYLTGTTACQCRPGTFNTPALGLDVVILDDAGQPAEEGELFLVPPSLGLSTTLVGQDHHEVYLAGVPRGPNGEILRRHGDRMERLADGFWHAHGRADDTMNLGGIKVSSAEIERVMQGVPEILEAAAIAVAPAGGPSHLVIYAVTSPGSSRSKAELVNALQGAIKTQLNPLFKIHELILVETLPRTASNKVLRRDLRARYLASV